MTRLLKQLGPLTTLLFAGVMVLALLAGCSSSQTTSGSQEIAKPLPPPPPPPKQEEMVAEAAAAPAEDPLAWAAGLADLHFDTSQSKIRKDDKAGLDALAQKMKEDPKRKVLVEGYCDSRGTSNYNLILGERRAKAVKQYLVKAVAPTSQIEVLSFGKEKPFCREMTDECWQSNRRAHFTAQ
ncbi:MAG: peptidoglycan-associated lipoprotein [Nitrospiraceae bacterium]|nr:peptidoglycan-associated lipoprotein [Nitrospiraceae bacterium]MSR24175.1 peptidoglycan-associated lipoprotein [Nitrospiraceae bacterium]